MDCGTYYNPNSNNSSSSSTPILIPSSCSTRATDSTRNAKNNKKKAAAATGGGVRLSTDPQSVAARERRHKISDRFKMLQSLVPGGAKLDTVSMLEQAIQYVKFLKAQIWLHEALIKNNNNVNNNNIINTTTTSNNNNNQDYHYDNHSFISTTTINNDAYYYDHEYCYTLMYDYCNNKNVIHNHHEGGGGGGGASVGVIQGGFDGGFRNPQEINNMVAATTSYRAIQVSSDGCCSFHHGHGQQSM